MTKESFIKNAREKLGPLEDRMDYIEKETEFLPGIHVIAAPGHTPGHMVVSFSSGGEQLFYVGDTVLYPLHLEHPDWLSVYDILPGKAENHALVIGQHFAPFQVSALWLKKRMVGFGNLLRRRIRVRSALRALLFRSAVRGLLSNHVPMLLL